MKNEFQVTAALKWVQLPENTNSALVITHPADTMGTVSPSSQRRGVASAPAHHSIPYGPGPSDPAQGQQSELTRR